MGDGFGSEILTILGMLIVFAAVLFVAWLTTKLLGKKLSGSSKNKTMKVVETLQIGMDRCLYLIKAGNRFFLFNASRKSLELVSEIEIDEDALADPTDTGNKASVFDFKRIFEFYSGLGKKGKSAEPKDDTNILEEAVGKSDTGGLLKNINKLKKITRGDEQYKG